MSVNERLALLIGLLLSDGSVYFDKSKKTYCIQLTNKDPELLTLFKELMRECFGFTNFSINRCKNAISLRVFSVKVARELFSYSPSYRTKACKTKPVCADPLCDTQHTPIDGVRYPSCKIPEVVLDDKKLLAAFLKGFASSDGTLYCNSKYSVAYVAITSHHPSLRNEIMHAINLLGLSATRNRHEVRISGIENTKKFLEIVGFIPERTLTLKTVSSS